MIDKIKPHLSQLLWFFAGIIVLIDPSKIYELAHKHEAWSTIILAVWTSLMAWAHKLTNVPQPKVSAPTIQTRKQ